MHGSPRKFVFFLFSAVFLRLILPAQSPNYIHYTTYDGLASQVTYCVMQDSKGFIWIGTENGLCRFDGREFKTFTTDDGLPDNEVLQITEDKTNRLWLTLFNGGACYMKDGKFYSVQNDTTLAHIQPVKNFMGYYFPENEIGFYAYGDKHLYYLDYQLNILYYYDKFLFGRSTTFGDSDPNIIYSKNNITKLSAGKIVKELPLDQLLIKNARGSYNSRFKYQKIMYYKKDKSILEIAILNNKLVVDTVLKRSFPYTFRDIKKLGSYYYFMTLSNALLRYHVTDTFFISPEVYMTGATFNDIINDNEGGCWLTSLDNGLYYIPNENATGYTKNNGLRENSVYEIFELKNQIHFTDHKGNIYSTKPIKNVGSLNDGKEVNRVLSSAPYGNGVYFATDRGIILMNSSYQIITKPAPNYSTKDITILHDTVYWAHLGGLFKNFIGDSDWFDTLIVGRKTTVTIDQLNRVWYGELNGCFIIDTSDKIISLGDKFPALKTRIAMIRRSADNIMWIATQANGLVGMQNDSVIFHLTKKSGLSTNNIKSIFVTGTTVVTATDKGVDIIHYNIPGKTISVTNFDKFKGLADNDVNRAIIKDDTLYAGTAQGLSIIPLKIKSLDVAPPVYITGFTINNKDTFFNTDFSLPYFKNNLIISYSGISFVSGTNIKYRYRLFAHDPFITTVNNSVTFAELQPGNYQFEVEAQNINGIWSSNSAKISFTIEPPFWKRLRFIWSISFLAAGTIAYAYYYRLKNYRNELQLQNRMLHSEIKALRAQMNPHFIFNSLNSIQQFIFTNKKEEANEYLSEFAKLMRMMLEHSKENFIAVAEELQFLRLYLKLEQHRLGNRFEYNISFNEEFIIETCYIPSMVLQPFVENAIVHGLAPKSGQGMLDIKFELLNKNLLCKIKDNGVGRKNLSKSISDKHSFAIKATQDRINAINSAHHTKVHFKIIDLTNTTNESNGTLIEINFPEVNTY